MGAYLRTLFRTRQRIFVWIGSALLMIAVTLGLRLLLMDRGSALAAGIIPSALIVAWVVWIGAQASRWRRNDDRASVGN